MAIGGRTRKFKSGYKETFSQIYKEFFFTFHKERQVRIGTSFAGGLCRLPALSKGCTLQTVQLPKTLYLILQLTLLQAGSWDRDLQSSAPSLNYITGL